MDVIEKGPVNLELEHINEIGAVISVSQEKHKEGKRLHQSGILKSSWDGLIKLWWEIVGKPVLGGKCNQETFCQDWW